ncbi:hypothetical protein VM1G_00984 [Cytospora mali]|uniref:Uncharacterized protein n=1 Tax=Cytospora mali TaxID=578113 RepID=A0A194VLI8_CYTMA|nr:hypothetical protein VM1G_00984 [Valsa mali]
MLGSGFLPKRRRRRSRRSRTQDIGNQAAGDLSGRITSSGWSAAAAAAAAQDGWPICTGKVDKVLHVEALAEVRAQEEEAALACLQDMVPLDPAKHARGHSDRSRAPAPRCRIGVRRAMDRRQDQIDEEVSR